MQKSKAIDGAVMLELETGVRFLGAGDRCPRWTEATREDHEEAIRDFEAVLARAPGWLDAEAIKETRHEILKHRSVLQGTLLIFVTRHPDFPVISVPGVGGTR
jgi:hypothetical protein